MSNKKRILNSVSPENLENSLNIIAGKFGKNPKELLLNFNNGLYDVQIENLNSNEVSQLINILNSSFLLRMALVSPGVTKKLKDILS